jgi:hypothetical protein
LPDTGPQKPSTLVLKRTTLRVLSLGQNELRFVAGGDGPSGTVVPTVG